MYKKLSNIDIDAGTALHIYSQSVKTSMLYGSEIWGMLEKRTLKQFSSDNSKHIEGCHFFENLPQEKIAIKFAKFILGVGARTTNCGVRGELGLYPLYTDIIVAMIKMWCHILNKRHSLVYEAYLSDFDLASVDHDASWAGSVKTLLTYYGFAHVWDNQGTLNVRKFSRAFKLKVQESYRRHWKNTLAASNKLSTYRKFKNNFEFEEYLNIIKKQNLRSNLTKFRLSNHPFKIETGRYHKPKIERSNRVCWLCAPNFLPSLPVEDEHHIIYECNFFTSLRNKFLKPETDQITIENLFNSPPQFINRLSRFINACIVERAEYRKLF